MHTMRVPSCDRGTSLSFPLICDRRVRRAGRQGRRSGQREAIGRPVPSLGQVTKILGVTGSSQAPTPPWGHTEPEGRVPGPCEGQTQEPRRKEAARHGWGLHSRGSTPPWLATERPTCPPPRPHGARPSKRTRVDVPASRWRKATREVRYATTAYTTGSVRIHGWREADLSRGAPGRQNFPKGRLPDRWRRRRGGLRQGTIGQRT